MSQLPFFSAQSIYGQMCRVHVTKESTRLSILEIQSSTSSTKKIGENANMGVSKKRGTQKMDGENNGKPYEQMDDLGGFSPYFWVDTHMHFLFFLTGSFNQGLDLPEGCGWGGTWRITPGIVSG